MIAQRSVRSVEQRRIAERMMPQRILLQAIELVAGDRKPPALSKCFLALPDANF